MRKIYIGSEDETTSGPNFPRRYRIEVDIANGQVVHDLDVTDLLPNNLAFLQVVSTSPAGASVIQTPTVGAAANAPNNDLVVNFPSVTGTTSTTDVSVTFEFYVPFSDANGVPVIDPATADDVVSQNQALAVGDWTPIDSRDAGGIDNAIADPAGYEHTLNDQANAVQKAVAVAVGGPDANPGDTLEYTLTLQISDFFAFQNLNLTDTLSDGQRLDPSFAPTFSLQQHGSTSAGMFAPANFATIDHFTGGTPAVAPIDGTQAIEFRVSDELLTRLLDARVLGGCVPVGGTGGPAGLQRLQRRPYGGHHHLSRRHPGRVQRPVPFG